MTTIRDLRLVASAAIFVLLAAACAVRPAVVEPEPRAGYIVQAAGVEEAARAVEAVGGVVTHELAIIRAVGTRLTARQVKALRERPDVRRVFEDATLKVSSVCAVAAGGAIFEDK